MSSEIEYNEIFRKIGDLSGVKADNVQLRADLAQADEDRQNSAAEIIRLRGELAAWQEAFGTDTPEQSAISVSRRLEDAGRVAAELHAAVDALRQISDVAREVIDNEVCTCPAESRYCYVDRLRAQLNHAVAAVAAYDAKHREGK